MRLSLCVMLLLASCGSSSDLTGQAGTKAENPTGLKVAGTDTAEVDRAETVTTETSNAADAAKPIDKCKLPESVATTKLGLIGWSPPTGNAVTDIGSFVKDCKIEAPYALCYTKTDATTGAKAVAGCEAYARKDGKPTVLNVDHGACIAKANELTQAAIAAKSDETYQCHKTGAENKANLLFGAGRG
jgi:hypothetical protein